MIIGDLINEQMAGYITPDNIVYSYAPDYIQEMAKETNKEYQKLYNKDYFRFEKSADIFGKNPPEIVREVREKLEKEYLK